MKKNLAIILVVVILMVVAAITLRNRTGSGRQIQQAIETTSTAIATLTAPATECGSDEQCRNDAVRTCANVGGRMTYQTHGHDTDGEIDKNKVATNTLRYVFERIDEEDGCHFTLQKSFTSGNTVNFYCTSAMVTDTQAFFADWQSGSFLDNAMAYCNPVQDDDTSIYPWECNYQTGIHCDLDRSL